MRNVKLKSYLQIIFKKLLNSFKFELQCLRDADFFKLITGDGASTLDSNLLEEKCPMILYHLLARSEFEKENGCIYVPQHEDAQPDATFGIILQTFPYVQFFLKKIFI